MACGHVSTGIYTTEEGEKIPICIECAKKTPDLAKERVDLKGRVAACHLCGNLAPSSPDLFAFQYKGDKKHDSFYDNCRG